METIDIFSALAKYNSARDENYLTEAFVFLINSLLAGHGGIDRGVGCDLLTRLCSSGGDFGFVLDESIEVSTQDVTEQGTPDIRIVAPEKFIYVEVKHDSPVGERQISRYKKALEHSTASLKKVVLLTRFPVAFKDEEEKPYKHVHWYEVYNWLAELNNSAKDPVNRYLMSSFDRFLEEKRMSIQKVGWEYINGVPALLNLLNMIEVAIESAGIKLYRDYPRATALEWRGFYLNSNEILCGVYYSDPMTIVLQVVDKRKFDVHRVPKPTYGVREDRRSIWFSLGLEKYHFFSLDKDGQLKVVTDFVRASYAEAQAMRLGDS
jgi:hypothetical protein